MLFQRYFKLFSYKNIVKIEKVGFSSSQFLEQSKIIKTLKVKPALSSQILFSYWLERA